MGLEGVGGAFRHKTQQQTKGHLVEKEASRRSQQTMLRNHPDKSILTELME